MNRLEHLARTVTAFGFNVENVNYGDREVNTPEFTFVLYHDSVGVIGWTGSWPFASDHDLGVIEGEPWEAVSYANWLAVRDAWYDEQNEKALERSLEEGGF